jgi:vancomycin resistance protein YoaR
VAGDLRVIREGQDGKGLDIDWLRSQARQSLLGADRSLPLVVTVVPAAISSSDGPKLGIRELVREGRTSFAGGVAEKQHNIRLAVSRLHGVVVAPGATFSFNREVGPTTLEAGFRSGWGITISSTGAQTVPSVAGGICQVATTLFQPVFHAGYAIEERHSHLYWIQSYGQAPLGMKGLDATVDEDYGLDMQFINSTPDYLLVQARVEGTTLIFSLFGTKPTWDVKIEGPTITNVVPADRTPVSRAEPTMPNGRTLQVESAQDGFDVTIARTVTQGADVRTLRLRSHYVPSQNVVLYGPGAEPTPTVAPTPPPPSSSAMPAQIAPRLPTPAPTRSPLATVAPAH